MKNSDSKKIRLINESRKKERCKKRGSSNISMDGNTLTILMCQMAFMETAKMSLILPTSLSKPLQPLQIHQPYQGTRNILNGRDRNLFNS